VAIVIDDSGSPGSKIESQFLTNIRKTWVAVLINDEQIKTVKHDLYYINDLLNKKNIDELHLTDLINGNNNYKIFNQETKLNILKAICMFYKEYQFPFFVQTTNPETLTENGLVIKIKKLQYGTLDIANHEHQGLVLLFLRIIQYLKDNNKLDEDIDFIIDEDSKNKPGKVLKVPILLETNKTWIPRFESSKNEKLLQIADFVAYSVNRSQTTIVKGVNSLTSFDKEVFLLISDALKNSGVSGVQNVKSNINNFDKDYYDYEQIKYRQNDGTLDKYWNWRKIKGII